MKTTRNITLDTDIVAEMHARQIPISPTVNSYLRHFLNMANKVSEDKEELTREANKLQAEAEKCRQKIAVLEAQEEQHAKKAKHTVIIE